MYTIIDTETSTVEDREVVVKDVMNEGRWNGHRPRHTLLHFLLWASSSSLRIADCASTSSTSDDNEGRHHFRAHHHLFHEIDFLAKQSMIMGDYHVRDDVGNTTSSTNEEHILRLRFLEKSILIELEYMKILDEMMKNPDEILSAYNANNKAKTRQKNTPTTLGKRIADTISIASWPTIAFSPQLKHTDSSSKLDHDYDYDSSLKHGYLEMYSNLNCWYHARDQNKPMYTPEMWEVLWDAFRESTLFPFPSDICPKEPFYAAYTKDDKGRGVFASRNITKGSLVHAGYPNTVFFLDKKSWFRFVSLLPKMFACGKSRVCQVYTTYDFNS
jgi:hypothetical protein